MAEPVIEQKKDFKIDAIDRQILNLLIANARDSTRTIVKKLEGMGTKMSERGVGKRIERLEKLGIIHGYTTMVDLNQVNMPILRLITVKFTSPKDFVTRLDEMKEYLTGAPYCDFSATSFLTIMSKPNKKKIFIEHGLEILWKITDHMILIFTKWGGSSLMRMILIDLFRAHVKKKGLKPVQMS
jgi:DNA-binding Lrp family transcriptional regulator